MNKKKAIAGLFLLQRFRHHRRRHRFSGRAKVAIAGAGAFLGVTLLALSPSLRRYARIETM